jgi:hypothetical protein
VAHSDTTVPRTNFDTSLSCWNAEKVFKAQLFPSGATDIKIAKKKKKNEHNTINRVA